MLSSDGPECGSANENRKGRGEGSAEQPRPFRAFAAGIEARPLDVFDPPRLYRRQRRCYTTLEPAAMAEILTADLWRTPGETCTARPQTAVSFPGAPFTSCRSPAKRGACYAVSTAGRTLARRSQAVPSPTPAVCMAPRTLADIFPLIVKAAAAVLHSRERRRVS